MNNLTKILKDFNKGIKETVEQLQDISSYHGELKDLYKGQLKKMSKKRKNILKKSAQAYAYELQTSALEENEK